MGIEPGIEPALPAVEYAERSDPGRDPDKQVNEDACGHRETRFGHLCVVCDGMGGHAAGREAAELAVATIFETFETAPEGTPPGKLLAGSVEEASRRVHSMQTSEVAMGRPGSTAVAILMHGGGTEVAHVGDSRVYMVHEGQIIRVTRDHSVVQELVDRGLLTLDQAAHHPDANRITRALGMSASVEAELRPEPVHHVAGDAFVLCSDGLCDLVEDHEILAIVGAEPAAQAVGKLVDLANARGGHDNITVIVLRARESAVPRASVTTTVAQTAVTPVTLPAAPPAASPTPTLIEPPPRERVTEPTLPAALPPAPPFTPPPSSARPRAHTSPAVIFGIVLAALALTLLALWLVVYVTERSGKRNTPALPPTLADASAPSPPVPEAAPPSPPPPREPIVPLQPSPAPSFRPRRGSSL